MKQTVAEIMTKDLATVTLQDNIYEIAVLMREKDTGFVPVVENGKMVGVVTDRDLVIRGYAEKRSGSASVEQVMTKDIRTIDPEMQVDEAAEIMSRDQIRRLPVVRDGRLLGVVSIGDLAVRHVLMEEAGAALSQISEPDRLPFPLH